MCEITGNVKYLPAILGALVAFCLFALSASAQTGTINQLDQWKATTTPFNAIAPNVHAKNIYAPFSWATTSSLTATRLCLTGDICITAWPGSSSGFSTSSADYWITQTSIEALSDVSAMTESYGDLFSWNGSAWTNIATSSLKLGASALNLLDITLADFTNDAGFLTGNQSITLSGDVTGSGATSITTTIANGAVDTFDLATTSAIADGEYLQWDSDGTFYGVTCAEITGSADLCDGNDASGSGGTGNVATSSAETATYIPFWTSTGATPALLSGGENTFTYNATDNRLTTTYASSTGFTASYASSSAAHFGTLNLKNLGDGLLELSSGVVQLATAATDYVAGGTGANTQVTYFTGAGAITGDAGMTYVAADDRLTLGYASTTGVSGSYASSSVGRFGQLFASNQSDGCAQYSSGQITSTGAACGGSGSWPFNTETHGGTTTQSTTSPLWLKFGLHASSTSAFDDILAARATTTSATTTNLYVSGQLDIGSQTGLALTTSGVISAYAGASCTNQFPRSQDASGVWTCATVANTDLANSTISGIALGSNLANLTATDSTLTFSGAYNGGTARTVGLNLANPNSWTALQQFTNATSTLFSATYASTTQLLSYFASTSIATTTSATTTNFHVSGQLDIGSLSGVLVGTSGVVSAGVDGTDYTLIDAVTCTNQVLTAFTAAGVGTCASINNAMWSGTDLSVANGGTGLSTFGGVNHVLYTTAADTLSSEAAFTYDASVDRLTIGYASSTGLSTSYASSSIARFGQLFVSNQSDGCAQYVSGQITSTGSACGGAGASDEKWATSTVDSTAIHPNGASKVGIGTTTPWGTLSIAGAPGSAPVFAVATTGTNGTSQLVNVFASSTASNFGGVSSHLWNGARVVIGEFSRAATNFLLWVNGPFASSWKNNFCDTPLIPASLSADAGSICGFLSFDEGTTATLNQIAINISGGAYQGLQLSVSSAVTADGATLIADRNRFETLATTTPKMEVVFGEVNNVSTTTGFYMGFLNVDIAGAATRPTIGCFFAATSTQNWLAVCDDSLTETIVDTGIATSTSNTYIAKAKVEMGSGIAKFYMAVGEYADYTKVAEMTTSIPTSGVRTATVQVSRLVNGTAVAPNIYIVGVRLWSALGIHRYQLPF